MQDNPTELWRPIVGYEAIYSISSLGRIRREVAGHGTYAGRISQKAPKHRWYITTPLYIAGQRKTHTIHKLVAEAFLGPANGRTVNHKDGNKQNNRLENLEYMTPGENLQHAFATGLRETKRGERHWMTTLTESEVRQIRASREGLKACAARYGTSRATVQRLRKRETWGHLH